MFYLKLRDSLKRIIYLKFDLTSMLRVTSIDEFFSLFRNIYKQIELSYILFYHKQIWPLS